MKKIIASVLITFFVFCFSAYFGSLGKATSENVGQSSQGLNAPADQELFKTFKKLGPPQPGALSTGYCSDCINDCSYCPEYCWPKNGICNTCKTNGTTCPSKCDNCSNCHYCKKGGFCCLFCTPKPSTCNLNLKDGQEIN